MPSKTNHTYLYIGYTYKEKRYIILGRYLYITTTRPCPRRYSALTCSALLQYTIKATIKLIINLLSTLLYAINAMQCN